jgi:hypothetical protein
MSISSQSNSQHKEFPQSTPLEGPWGKNTLPKTAGSGSPTALLMVLSSFVLSVVVAALVGAVVALLWQTQGRRGW